MEETRQVWSKPLLTIILDMKPEGKRDIDRSEDSGVVDPAESGYGPS